MADNAHDGIFSARHKAQGMRPLTVMHTRPKPAPIFMPVVAFCRVVGVDPRSGVLGGNKMLRHMSRVVAPRLAACSAAVGTMATIAGIA